MAYGASITSRQHALVRRFRAAARGDDVCALVDGWHLLHEAKAAGLSIDVVALTPAAAASHQASDLGTVPTATAVVTVSDSVMAAMSPVRTPSGVVALVERREHPLARAIEPVPALAVVAIDLQDPGNAGAIVRAADAGGATGVVFGGASADPWGWKALRASMGSTFRLPVIRTRDQESLMDQLTAANIALAAAVPRGGVTMEDVDLAVPTALLIGGEGAGVPAVWLERASTRISIPMTSAVESLNAALAAAILVYEARRQRRGPADAPRGV